MRIPCPDCDGLGSVRNWNLSPEALCDLIDCPTCAGRCEIDADPADVTDETWEFMMNIENDNAAATTPTPTLDTVFAVLAVLLTPGLRWMLAGWAAHLRLTRHQNHAASSWAKHRGEFGSIEEHAKALAVARILDFGLNPEAAAALLQERVAARAAKAADGAA